MKASKANPNPTSNPTESVVAVYGTLRRGFGNHGILARGGARYLGTGATAPDLAMYSLGGFPGALPGLDTAIVCELYAVNPETLRRLDALEGHPRFYQRRRLGIAVRRDDGFESVEAWIYFIRPEFVGDHTPEIVSGDWAAWVSEGR